MKQPFAHLSIEIKPLGGSIAFAIYPDAQCASDKPFASGFADEATPDQLRKIADDIDKQFAIADRGEA